MTPLQALEEIIPFARHKADCASETPLWVRIPKDPWFPPEWAPVAHQACSCGLARVVAVAHETLAAGGRM